ncbi:hypothetical protein [Sulfurimonas sp.]
MLVYIDDREDEELHSHHDYAYVYEYEDEDDYDYGYDYGGEEDTLKESYQYEINEDYYLVP